MTKTRGRPANVTIESLHDSTNMNTQTPIALIELLRNIFIFKPTVSLIAVVSAVNLDVISPGCAQDNFWSYILIDIWSCF